MNILFIACSIAIIAGSAYGLGLNTSDKNSTNYQTAASFLGIGVSLNVFFIISLIVLVLLYSGNIQTEFTIPPN